MNLVFEITSENNSSSDSESGITDPPKFKIKKMKMVFLDTGGKLKTTVMSLWVKVIIQPTPEQIVRELDIIHFVIFMVRSYQLIPHLFGEREIPT